jgi:hypothetical protein
MRFASVLALLSCFAATACGTASTQQAADKTEAVSAPPVEAIDEPARDDVAYLWTHEDYGSYAHTYFCLSDSSTESDDACKMSPKDAEKLRRIGEAFERALRPAEGSEPRRIARLRLRARGPKSQAFLIAWRNRMGKLCLADSEEDEGGGGGGGGGAFGPCVPEGPCTELCLTLSGTGSGQNSLYSTSGVVTSEADALRITFDDGRIVTYELAGPVVPGFHEYRVFMLDLGRGLDARLELLAKDKVIAEETRSRAELKSMRCGERLSPGPMPPTETPREREEAWKACMREKDSD